MTAAKIISILQEASVHIVYHANHLFMRPVMLFLLLCTPAITVFAQQKELDSLQHELTLYPLQDSNRLRILNQLSYSYCFNDPAKGMVLAEQARLLAIALHSPVELGTAYNNKGFCFYTKGAFDTSLVLHKIALDIFTKEKKSVLMARVLNRIGGNYISLASYVEAMKYLQQGLAIAEKDNNRIGIAAAHGNMSTIYLLLSDYAKALREAFISIDIYKEQGRLLSVANMSNNVATIYLKQKNYDKSIEYNLKALRINDSMVNKKGIANDYLDLGNAYREKKNYSLALDYLSKSLALYQFLGSRYNASLALSGIAAVYNQAPDSLLQKQGISSRDRFQVAVKYQHHALALAIETGTLDNLSTQWESLSRIFESNHVYDSALYAYRQYALIHDSIAGDKKKQEVTRREALFESEKKEAVLNAEHALQLRQEKNTRNTIVIGSVMLLFAGILFFVFYKRKKTAETKQKEAVLQAAITETAMKALRAQMNPHFIFNSLNSISDYIARNNTELADEYLTKFAKLMRLVLENSEKKEVLLSDDLKALGLYIQLEALRLSNKFTFQIKVDPAIDPEMTLVPPLLLQPFVENSIWHGLAKKQGTGNILIEIKKEGTMINCIVEDNGIGRQGVDDITGLKDNKERRSLGMKITKERIDMLNQVKNANAAVELSYLPEGTRVELRIPLELNF